MSGYYILDEHGDPKLVSDVITWGSWYETADRQICDDRVGDVRVSTVFLGLDHSFLNGDPLLFETMVFGGPLDQEQRRYTTRSQAMEGHAEVLAEVKAAGAE